MLSPQTSLPPTQEMIRALRALQAQGSLIRFRVGWGHTSLGPFFKRGTIDGLASRGLVDFTAKGQRAFLTREGLARLGALETEAA